MHDWPRHLIGLIWLFWALLWLAWSLNAKPVRTREGWVSRLCFVIPLVLVALLLLAHRGPDWLTMRIVPGGWVRYWIAVGLLVVGMAFAIWARAILGGNWSGTVTVKEGHELVERGPYRRIRHPIYTGLLLAVLGTALAGGRLYGLLAFVIALLALIRKLRVEERFMGQEFGERYADYRRRSHALIPWIY